jgi:hypothetical protein
VKWDKKAQLRHSALCLWPTLRGGRRAEFLRTREHLQQLGYDGCIASISADSILEGWEQAGWIQVSPNHSEIRLTPDGEEQLARWQEEDRLWQSGEKEEVELPKRLKAGQPFTNLRRISQLIGSRTVVCLHDPYTDATSLLNLVKLNEFGTPISPNLRLLGSPAGTVKAKAIAACLVDINTEKRSQWEMRTYSTPERPHRRFLVCGDGTVITCGLSLNNLNKDEVFDVIPGSDSLAEHDRQFFEEKWKQGSVLR